MSISENKIAEIALDEEGYLMDNRDWTEDLASLLAKEEGIENLTSKHWDVINFLRKYFQDKSQLPTMRALTKSGVVSVKELYTLFPGGPLKKAARIAGLKKPTSCV